MSAFFRNLLKPMEVGEKNAFLEHFADLEDFRWTLETLN